jgi:teichuronic acid biosynthesis glycosyltransferase TuaG
VNVSPAPPAAPRRDRVSVVMPVYNAASTLAQSMESVLAQSHGDVELVVVDDGSSDRSWALIDAFAQRDPRVVAIRQPNAGVAAARNAGIDAASGDCMAFLDSDDWWHPCKLEIQLAGMRAAGALASYTAYQRVDPEGRALSMVQPPPRVDHAAMLRSNRIGNLTGLYDRCLGDPRFARVGHEDYVFWLQVVRRAGSAVRVDHAEPLAFYRVQPGSLSADKLRAARWQWRIYRDNEALGWLPAAWYFMHYAANAVAKRRPPLQAAGRAGR